MNTRKASFVSTLLGSALLFGLVACQKTTTDTKMPASTEPTPAAKPASTPELTTLEQKVSYSIGRNIAADISRNAGFQADAVALAAGLTDGLAGKESPLSEAELQACFQEIRQQAQAKASAAGVENLAKANAFLAQNKTRAGVVTTASGLQYEIMTAGTGPKPTPTNKVKVHYHGTLIDGTVFDSSVQRGEPIEFPVTGVIQGWIEALQLMPLGSKWKLFIPPALAYGERGQGGIPANSALIFEVELLEIN